ncbi:MAG: lamin tail domain-containing protein [Phycisphaerales bacterium]
MNCKGTCVPMMVCLCLLQALASGQDPVTPQIVINEIYYDPQDPTSHLEFIELFNAGAATVDMSGWYFSSGITYTFPQGAAVPAGGYIVVAEDPLAFVRAFGVACCGPFTGRLSNEGETLTLRDSSGNKRDAVDYKMGFPWPTDTEGRSIELVNPGLDNSLGGSWRACGYKLAGTTTEDSERSIFAAQSSQWQYRKGLAEPPADWMQPNYAEGRGWIGPVTAPIGYDAEGGYPVRTLLSDMQGHYSTVYLRCPFQIRTAQEMPDTLALRLFVDDGCIVWINGMEVGRYGVSGGAQAYDALSDPHEAAWERFEVWNPATYLRVGTNWLAVQLINDSLDSDRLALDLELLGSSSGDEEALSLPTPGAANSVLAANAPPQIRQVTHAPVQPASDKPIVITAKVTDPESVAQVSLSYQVVQPGDYIPAWLPVPLEDLDADAETPRPKNPEFHDPANWTSLAMTDDGAGSDAAALDEVFTAVIPGQPNRTLVRYRITAFDAAGEPLSVTVPYDDDAAMNFACWVYDGVPPYVAKTSVLGSPHTYSTDILQSLPVYTLITRARDLAECYAYRSSDRLTGDNGDPSRKAFNWEGAFVFDSTVYDHINYRLRGANGRYHLAGKRSMKIRFNRGADLQATDRFGRPYPEGWHDLLVSKMFDNRTQEYGQGNFGMTEAANSVLWNLVGVPTWDAYWFHFRVVDGEEEAPDQYHGDFWGLFLAMEDYDGRFMDRLGLPDGNLYKFSSGIGWDLDAQRHQGRDAVNDASDCVHLQNQLTWGRSEQTLRQLVNYEKFFRYLAVAQAVRQYDNDYAGEKRNIAWFFEPDPTGQNPFGWLWLLPYDTDLTWGPNWNDGPQQPWVALEPGGHDGKAHTDNPGGMTAMKMEFRNYVREFRDLLWNEETINPLLEDLAAIIRDFAPADQDRWTHLPSSAYSSDKDGQHVTGHYSTGTFTWSLDDKVDDMKRFAFIGNHTWSSGNVSGFVPPGGRAAVLDEMAGFEGDAAAVPYTPTASYAGPAGYPRDALTFQAGPFADPQGSQTFAAMQWRIAEFSDVNSPDYDPADRKYEVQALWQSEEIAPYQASVTIPSTGLQAGRLYRVRVRMKDTTGRWSHWSKPVEFVAGPTLNSDP